MPLQLRASAPTDFDFVVGDWTVKHRRLREQLADCQEWVDFDGEMATQKILGGYGNIEDNRLLMPDNEFRAVALRSFDREKGMWSIWWLDGRLPGSVDVPVVGNFTDGIGTFYAADTFKGIPITVRFIWSQSTADVLRWEQAFSRDDGLSWETNWTMDFTRKREAQRFGG